MKSSTATYFVRVIRSGILPPIYRLNSVWRLDSVWRLALVVGAVLIVGCGKYAAPFAPEQVSPSAIRNLQVTPSLDGVKFAWEAPETNQRSKELKNIEGYRIERKIITKESDVVDPRLDFSELAVIPDAHIEKRDQLREQARSEGKVGRKVRLPAADLHFEFSDTSVIPGGDYVYRIVPLNNGGTEGEVTQIIRVVFRGQNTSVQAIQSAELDDLGLLGSDDEG